MKKLKEKKGVSLIILIITIIIMIILATTVILSVSNSGIIEKANKAKQDSDSASIKEYVSILQAEWELMSKTERAATGYSSKEEYVNAKLEEKGYNLEESEDSWISVEEAKKVLEIGDVVEYKVTAKTETSKSADNGDSDQTISNRINYGTKDEKEFVWRYIGVSDDGKIMIAPDITDGASKLTLYGATGYLKGPDELNRLCDELYSTDKGNATSMTIEDVNKLLGYTRPEGAYWNASGDYTEIFNVKTIAELEIELGVTLIETSTPDGEDIGTYKSDYYVINKEGAVTKMEYPDNREYVYFDDSYWLSSPCTRAVFCEFGYFGGWTAHFSLFTVYSSFVGMGGISPFALFFANPSEQRLCLCCETSSFSNI